MNNHDGRTPEELALWRAIDSWETDDELEPDEDCRPLEMA